jgi:ATP-dependent RNA helicase SUPV3L1/SUV3
MPEFRDEEVLAIEEHRFAPLDFLYWREGALDFAGVEPLIASLERRPARRELRPAPEAIDLAVLKLLAGDTVTERATEEALVRRLWAACGLPDFRKTGPEHHSRLVARIFGHLSEGAGHVPKDWFTSEVARLDNVQGDIDTLADRLAGIRTWAYVAHRGDWLAEPEAMAARAMAVEEKLSDALHERLTQRFVDRRTAVLMRDLGRGAAGDFPVVIDAEGEVSVGNYAIGRLNGFAFEVDPAARHADRKMLLATAERRLAGEYEQRAAALAADIDTHFALRTALGQPPALLWRGHEIARLGPGKNLLSPRVILDRRLESVSLRSREAIILRLKDWLASGVEQVLPSLRTAGHAAQDPAAPAPIRALLSLLVDEGGVLPRDMAAGALGTLDREQRRRIGQLGVRIGALDLFMPALLKPEPMRWRAALLAARTGEAMRAVPAAEPVLAGPAPTRLGYRAVESQAIRVDIAERLARRAHDARAGKVAEAIDESLVTSLGLKPQTVARLMRELGFQPSEGTAKWIWRGRRRPAPKRPPSKSSPFAALHELAGG